MRRGYALLVFLVAAGAILCPPAGRLSHAQQGFTVFTGDHVCVGEQVVVAIQCVDGFGRPQSFAPISTMTTTSPTIVASLLTTTTDANGIVYAQVRFTAPGEGRVNVLCTSPPAGVNSGGTILLVGYVLTGVVLMEPVFLGPAITSPIVSQSFYARATTNPLGQDTSSDTRPILWDVLPHGFAVIDTMTVDNSVANAASISISTAGTYTVTATDPCGDVVSATFTVVGRDVSFELHDDEGSLTGDPTRSVPQASGIDVSSLVFRLNGVAVPVSNTTMTVLSGPPDAPTGVRFTFTPDASLRTASGQNTLAVTALDRAGNPLDPSNTSLIYTLAPGTR